MTSKHIRHLTFSQWSLRYKAAFLSGWAAAGMLLGLGLFLVRYLVVTYYDGLTSDFMLWLYIVVTLGLLVAWAWLRSDG